MRYQCIVVFLTAPEGASLFCTSHRGDCRFDYGLYLLHTRITAWKSPRLSRHSCRYGNSKHKLDDVAEQSQAVLSASLTVALWLQSPCKNAARSDPVSASAFKKHLRSSRGMDRLPG
ncbi:hypothetical protein JZ751_017114 [Albula glossodonta]|uniref:Uncharacterized protein n=1 Tax=Albula glossodonta TaxID=121402 RepID=A0A8T2NRB8_9TELE|nr:hypothetical protein JZ751_017114 [Albula glossodonta]